jgi:hypothetical protein
MSEIWTKIDNLDTKNKNIINKYFPDKKGKYLIKNDILYYDIEDWGIENFYINCYTKNKSNYNIHYEYTYKIYDIAISVQIGNWNIFKKMENYLMLWMLMPILMMPLKNETLGLKVAD